MNLRVSLSLLSTLAYFGEGFYSEQSEWTITKADCDRFPTSYTSKPFPLGTKDIRTILNCGSRYTKVLAHDCLTSPETRFNAAWVGMLSASQPRWIQTICTHCAVVTQSPDEKDILTHLCEGAWNFPVPSTRQTRLPRSMLTAERYPPRDPWCHPLNNRRRLIDGWQDPEWLFQRIRCVTPFSSIIGHMKSLSDQFVQEVSQLGEQTSEPWKELGDNLVQAVKSWRHLIVQQDIWKKRIMRIQGKVMATWLEFLWLTVFYKEGSEPDAKIQEVISARQRIFPLLVTVKNNVQDLPKGNEEGYYDRYITYRESALDEIMTWFIPQTACNRNGF